MTDSNIPNLTVEQAIHALRNNPNWDIESVTETDRFNFPLFQLMVGLEAIKPGSVYLLCYFICRRVSAVWIVISNDDPWSAILEEIVDVLNTPGKRLALDVMSRVPPPTRNGELIDDCFLVPMRTTNKAFQYFTSLLDLPQEDATFLDRMSNAAFSVSKAYLAADEVPDECIGDFNRWVLEVAVPAAIEGNRLKYADYCRFGGIAPWMNR